MRLPDWARPKTERIEYPGFSYSRNGDKHSVTGLHGHVCGASAEEAWIKTSILINEKFTTFIDKMHAIHVAGENDE